MAATAAQRIDLDARPGCLGQGRGSPLPPAGHPFACEAHPTVPLRTWDQDETRIRPDRNYFGRCHVNDTFPARGAVERQRPLGEVINAMIAAGLNVLAVAEHRRRRNGPGD
ncbi:MAG: hypothetical protein ACR2MP_31000 [Streptosporangiaceae bacterium]